MSKGAALSSLRYVALDAYLKLFQRHVGPGFFVIELKAFLEILQFIFRARLTHTQRSCITPWWKGCPFRIG
jgi:hypothetical protein